VFGGSLKSLVVSQKGTIGITLPAEDMPFTRSGIQPDIILSTCAIPSRMTIGQLYECVVGKAAALEGKMADGTPFENYDIEEAREVLRKQGFEDFGYETLHCGFTGRKMEVQIFIGPTYYMRLKHMVQDKIQVRARGPTTQLTQQPPEGKIRDGGLRFGKPSCRRVVMQITASLQYGRRHVQIAGNSCQVLITKPRWETAWWGMLTAFRTVRRSGIGTIRSQAPKPVTAGHGEGSTTRRMWGGGT
jgi:hypothetical protein